MIFCANPRAQYLLHKQEIDAAIQKVLDSGNYVLGAEVEAFESEFSDHLGVAFSVGCGSGTDALALALKAMEIGDGDEVIVPSHTAVPTVAAIVMAGATPVFADVEPDYYTIDARQVEALCGERTKAIIAVHLYGQAADLEALLEITAARGLRLIEDCAQAVGATWKGKRLGTIGDVGCFSFFPTKNLGAIGDGGAVVCNDEQLAQRLRSLRQYGWNEQRVSQESGVNSRLDELQAAILRVKLKYLAADNADRKRMALYYSEELKDFPITLHLERTNASHVYHLYVIQVNEREKLKAHLVNSGVHAGIHYPVPVHRMKAYQDNTTVLPVTDRIVDRILSLPLYPGLMNEELEQVVCAVRAYYGG
ncbi:DegT/DnrJ/EryC1/StrS family aminotransferase [Pseudomonadota bacterium]